MQRACELAKTQGASVELLFRRDPQSLARGERPVGDPRQESGRMLREQPRARLGKALRPSFERAVDAMGQALAQHRQPFDCARQACLRSLLSEAGEQVIETLSPRLQRTTQQLIHALALACEAA